MSEAVWSPESASNACGRCGGACCETVTLEIKPLSGDFQQFIEYRSKPQLLEDGRLFRNFACPCAMLKAGRCVVYEGRPQMCRDFAPGGPQCKATVLARRGQPEADVIFFLGALRPQPGESSESAIGRAIADSGSNVVPISAQVATAQVEVSV